MGNTTGRIAVLGAWLTAAALCFASSAQAAKLVVSSPSGAAGSQVSFTVTLQAEGASVAGTQNDVSFDPAKIPVAPKASGKCSVTTGTTCTADGVCPSGEVCLKAPNCVVNPDIDKAATSFAFRPNKCTGTACTSIRALVLSTANTDPIADGSVLYTCNVNIAAGVTGSNPLTNSGIILSDPNGVQVAGATGVDGAVTVGGGPTPTVGGPTVTPTVVGPAPCTAPAIQGASVIATPGTVGVTFTLRAGTASVAGTQNDVVFDVANAPIAPKASGKCSVTTATTCTADGNCPSGEVCLKAPNCTVNPDIDKSATSFAFRPNKCTGTACTSIRALVLSTSNTDPIADGSVLYTCQVNFAATASLNVTGVILSDPNGVQIPGASGCNGGISTTGGPTPIITPTGGTPRATNTATATRTATATVPSVTPATNTPTAIRTNTVPPINTRTNTPGGNPTAAPTSSFFDDDGGCQISTAGSSSAGWLVLIPAVGLLVMRRRRR